MKGLLLKDVYVLNNYKKSFALYVVLILAFGIFTKGGSAYMTNLLTLLVISAVMGSFSYDESAKWDRFAAALPVSRRAIVTAKYLFALICTGVAVAAAVVLESVIGIAGGGGGVPAAVLSSGGVALLVSLLALGISLPLTFWLGPEKARMVSMVAYIAVFVLIFLGFLLLGDGQLPAITGLAWQLQLVAGGMAVFVALLFGLSYLVSVRMYTKRDF